MTRIFISGPITGKPNLNREAFDHEESLLREAGYEVWQPFRITLPNDETIEEWGGIDSPRLWQYCMKICVAEIPRCDEMRMLPDWQNSKGSVWEHRIAQMLGIPITYCYVPDSPTKW